MTYIFKKKNAHTLCCIYIILYISLGLYSNSQGAEQGGRCAAGIFYEWSAHTLSARVNMQILYIVCLYFPLPSSFLPKACMKISTDVVLVNVLSVVFRSFPSLIVHILAFTQRTVHILVQYFRFPPLTATVIYRAPLRAVVPGHVGVRNVKWVTGVVLSAEEAPGPWQRGMAYKVHIDIYWFICVYYIEYFACILNLDVSAELARHLIFSFRLVNPIPF